MFKARNDFLKLPWCRRRPEKTDLVSAAVRGEGASSLTITQTKREQKPQTATSTCLNFYFSLFTVMQAWENANTSVSTNAVTYSLLQSLHTLNIELSADVEVTDARTCVLETGSK